MRLLALIGVLGVAGTSALAQNNPAASVHDNSGLNGSLSRADLEKLNGDNKDRADAELARDPVLARARAQAQSEVLLKALQISCTVSNARLVAAGTIRAKSGSGEVESQVYEVACTGGMGYLLESQGSDAPLGISCLHAEQVRASDVAKARAPGYFCTLPENRDVYVFVSGLIRSGKGADCTVKELQWFGQSATTHTEYSEVSCQEGGGFMVQTPQPGSQAQTTIMSCAEAARRGISCRLTVAGPIETPITLDTFKAALAQNGVSCRIDRIQMIGQEDRRKRYVVEYRCVDQTASRVAFIPLQGNATPYEEIDCARAVQSGVICSYTD